MKMLDLFSGIGGFALAAQWIWEDDLDIRYFIENDTYCQRVLVKNFPGIPIHKDITTFRYTGPAIDLLTGGPPCQPYSVASKDRGGKKDDRHLWPEMLRIIGQAKPQWIVFENVLGIVRMELDTMLSDLEDQRYTCWTLDLPACAVDAYHYRHRIFIVAHTNSKSQSAITLNEKSQSMETHTRWEPEPHLRGVANGIPHRVDRNRSLGNAVVPQLAATLLDMVRKCGCGN